MFSLGRSGMGRNSRSLTSLQHRRADIHRSSAAMGQWGGWSGQIRNSKIYDRAGLVNSPGVARHVPAHAPRLQAGSRLRLIVVLSALIPFSFVLVQCGKSPSAEMLAANMQGAAGDSFDERFPKPQFRDRFPTPGESLLQRQTSDCAGPARARRRSPPLTVSRRWRRRCPTSARPREDQTTLVSLKSSAFPYFGNNPKTDEPFLNISKGDRRGHRSYRRTGLLAGRDL